MSTRTSPWPKGAPCWLDVVTPDLEVSRAFYGALFGWHIGDGRPEFGGYANADIDGRFVAGINPNVGDQPPAWTLYFATDDADATAAAITASGGTVLHGPAEVGEEGRMVLASDPAGAFFGAWEAGKHIGVQHFSDVGGLTWEDLRSTNADVARDFYGAVFGFEFTPLEMAGPDYSTFAYMGDPAPLGGIGGMMGMNGYPSHWIVYFGVADVDAAVVTTEQLGGHILSPGFDTPYGRMAAVTDPHGASFWLVNPTGAQPDRGE